MDRDQLSSRLLATFLGELEDQVRVMNAELLTLEREPANADAMKSLFRVAHTLKGAARAAGVPAIEQTCHALETLLVGARDETLTLGGPEFQLLFGAADALRDAGARLRSGGELDATSLAAVRAALTASKPNRKEQRSPTPLPPPPPPVQTSTASPRSDDGDGDLRVGAERLDALFAATSQLFLTGARLDNRAIELRALQEKTAVRAGHWRRARRELSDVLDPLRSSPSVRRAVDHLDEELRELAREVARLASESAEDARSLSRTNDDMLQRLGRLRIRPFADVCEGLPRVVRDIAMASGKDVELEIAGAEVEVDRAVLDALREAILHLVRNAVDHGIETATVRRRLGKRERGIVTVGAELHGERLVISVSDDGAGLDLRAIREQLVRHGLAVPDNDAELARTLFRGGLSTRTEASAISGRGVGLDLVRAAAERVHGSVNAVSTPNGGTTFTLECPPALASIRVVLCSIGAQVVGIPTASVERLLRVRVDDIKRADNRDVIVTRGGTILLVSLGQLLPPLSDRPFDRVAPVVVVAVGGRRAAIRVDELMAEQRIVVRPLSDGAAPAAIAGAAILGADRVALVLDPVALIDAAFALTTPGVRSAAPV
ncbi:MAG TPA: chemotaxis protein CheW, partial [Gemmatimonadaceae bacterium]|nr:chemotaxis protein CheW [Gemmatimonadaceae bacterium]